MLSRVFLFSFLCGMSIPCVLLGMNEVSWQEIRGMMHVSIGQEASGVGIGAAPAVTVAAVTSGPSSGGNTPHTILVLWCQVLPVSRYPSVGILHATVGISSSRRLEDSCVASKQCWPAGDGVHIGHAVGR